MAVTDANFNNASYSQFAGGYFLTKPMKEWFWHNYTTDARQRDNVNVSTPCTGGAPSGSATGAGSDSGNGRAT